MILRTAAVVAALAAAGCGPSRLDDAAAKKNAKAKAEELQAAFSKADHDTFTRLMHPKLVEMAGGREKMVAHLAAEVKSAKDTGYEYESFTVGEPSDPVRGGTDLYLTVPSTLRIKAPVGHLVTDSTLLGVSGDGGRTWVFINAVKPREEVKRVVPGLPDAVALPELKPPTFEGTKD